MSKLIDAEEYRQSLIANDWDECCDEFFCGGIFELLDEAPAVQAIPLDLIKQAREEIKNISQEVPYRNQAFSYGIRICETDKVLKILDKLISESEK